MERLTTTSEVIDRLGGDERVSALFGKGIKAVLNWRYSGKFPANTYIAFRVELAKQDSDADVALWNFQSLEAKEAAE